MKFIATTHRDGTMVELSLEDIESLMFALNSASIQRRQDAEKASANGQPERVDTFKSILRGYDDYWMDLYHLSQVAKGKRDILERELKTEDR